MSAAPTPVGPLGVAVVPLRVQRGLDVDETQEPMLREVLVPVPAIEGLDQGIVARLPGRLKSSSTRFQ